MRWMQGFEYAVLGGCLLMSVGLLLTCVLRYSLAGGASALDKRVVGGIPTECLGLIDLAGIGLIFAIYLGDWIDLGRPRVIERAGTSFLLTQLLFQLSFAGVVMGVLYHRVDFVKFWGLKPVRYWWAIGVTFTGFVAYFLFLELLWMVGFVAWADHVFWRIPGLPAGGASSVGVSDVLILGVMTVVLAPVVEEIVFRGYLYPVLKRMGGVWLAAATVSLFFAAAHLEGAYLAGRFFLSLILIASYEWTGSLWTPIGIHFLNNLYVFSNNFSE